MEQVKKLPWPEEVEEEDEVGLKRRSYHNGKNEANVVSGNGSNYSSCQSNAISSEDMGKKNGNGCENEGDSEVQGGESVGENRDNSVYFDTARGVKSSNREGTKNAIVEHPVSEKDFVDEETHTIKMFDTQKTVITKIYHQNVETLEDETLSASGIPFQTSQKKVWNDDNNDVVQKAIVDLAKEKLYAIQETGTCESDHQTENALENEILSSLDQSFPTSYEKVSATFKDFNTKTREDAVGEVTDERNGEMTEIDVERVLEKQDTHDLFCPNCRSCITRKVILVRKKRKVRNLRPKPKPNIVETKLVSELDVGPAYVADGQGGNTEHLPLIVDSQLEVNDEDIDDRDRTAFRCLSCFSLFIPNGRNFKLFGNSRNRNENGGAQNTQEIPADNTNRFLSFFHSNNGKPVIKEGNADQNGHTTTQAGMDETQHNQSAHASAISLVKGIQADQSGPASAVAVTSRVQTDKNGRSSKLLTIETQTNQNGLPSTVDVANEAQVDNKGPALTIAIASSPVHSINDVGFERGATSEPQETGKGFVNTSTQENIITEDMLIILQETPVNAVEKGKTDYMPPQHDRSTASFVAPALVENAVVAADTYQKLQPSGLQVIVPLALESSIVEQEKIEVNQKYDVPKSHVLNGGDSLVQEVPSSAQSFPHETGLDGFLSTEGSKILEGLRTDPREKSKDVVSNNQTGDNVVLTIGTEIASASQEAPNIVVPEGAGVLPLTRPQVQTIAKTESHDREARELDILKSIVYGGLIESITSLGIVSSAAGAGASTLNILVLAVANLIGGLFIIGHNLLELRDDSFGEASNQTDRYKEQLGRRENFLLHSTIVILSFLIFGLVAPITYAFSFRGSDNTEYKLLAVAASSLFCITLLAIGKGHVRTPKSYIKTMLYYITMGFMASGISFVVGILLDQLLEKLGLFESSSTVSMPPLEITGPKKELAWASY